MITITILMMMMTRPHQPPTADARPRELATSDQRRTPTRILSSFPPFLTLSFVRRTTVIGFGSYWVFPLTDKTAHTSTQITCNKMIHMTIRDPLDCLSLPESLLFCAGGHHLIGSLHNSRKPRWIYIRHDVSLKQGASGKSLLWTTS